MTFLRKNIDILSLIFIGSILFIPFLGKVHLFDWDEINFAEISREMILSNDFLRVTIDFLPFWEKPPLFFWLQVLSMKVFGISEFSARFPNALCGIATIWILFLIGKKLFNREFGIYWSLCYMGSFLPHFYFKSGIIDPIFNLFTFLALYFLILTYWKKRLKVGSLIQKEILYLSAAGLFAGLAVLTKGPVSLIIIFACLFIYFIYKRFSLFISIPKVTYFLLATIMVTFIWYGLEMLKHGPWFINEFISYQVGLFSSAGAGHSGFPGYHLVVILIGCFPASVLAFGSFIKSNHQYQEHQLDFKRWMIILLLVVIAMFMIVSTKIVHYSSMTYFPVTFLAAFAWYQLVQKNIKYSRWMTVLILAVGTLISLAFILAPIIALNKQLVLPYIKDEFAIANFHAQVHWMGWESMIGFFFLGILVCAVFLNSKGKLAMGLKVLFIGTIITVNTASYLVVPKIEGYSQRAAINFYKSLQDKDCYVQVIGYKSYAHLFYTKKSQPSNLMSYDTNWLLKGEIDKDAYFVCRINRTSMLENIPGIEKLESKNGFVFFKRSKVKLR